MLNLIPENMSKHSATGNSSRHKGSLILTETNKILNLVKQ